MARIEQFRQFAAGKDTLIGVGGGGGFAMKLAGHSDLGLKIWGVG